MCADFVALDDECIVNVDEITSAHNLSSEVFNKDLHPNLDLIMSGTN